MAVLEDGQRKLAAVWRSPAGATYLAEMGRVVEAMRATSEAARHNDQVMTAAADALDGKQKDFAVLSTAPIPEDARERYARAIVTSLDESYQQAVANFYPVPVYAGDFYQDRPLAADGPGSTESTRAGRSGGGSGTGGSRTGGGSATGGAPRQLPSWVPAKPADQSAGGSTSTDDSGSSPGATVGDGPQLQGRPGDAHPPGSGTYPEGGAHPRGGPSATPTGQSPPGQSWPLPGAGGVGSVSVGIPTQAPPSGPGRRLPIRSWIPGGRYPEGELASNRSATTAARVGAGSQPGAMVGGMPASVPTSSGQRPWQGYRRPPEPFPTTQQATAPPIIGPATPAEPEPDHITSDYEDEYGNRIMIRRPRD
jgi:hypothetical protein